MTDMNNVELDTRKTTVNPTGRGGWVAVTVSCLILFEGMTNVHGGKSVGEHQSFDPKGVNTVCYGHIEDVKIGDTYTKIQCEEMLAKDLPRYEAQVEKCIHVAMPGYRHAAVLSFDYNVGGGALCKSSVARYINAGEWQKGCDALLLYDRAAGKVLPGLVKRRQSERKMCYNVDEPPLPNEEVMAAGRAAGEGDITANEEVIAKPVIVHAKKPVKAPVPLPAPKPLAIPATTQTAAPAQKCSLFIFCAPAPGNKKSFWQW